MAYQEINDIINASQISPEEDEANRRGQAELKRLVSTHEWKQTVERIRNKPVTPAR